MSEKIFDKYETIGPDYHYQQIDKSNLRAFNASVRARFETLVKHVTNLAEHKPLRVLDVGCGDGVALYLIHRSNPDLDLAGVDESDKAIAVARKKIPGEFKVGSVYKLPFPDNSFDLVISSDVIEHVSDPDKMLEEMKRVAKQDSPLIIGTPIRRTKDPIDPHHFQEFYTEDFLELIERHFTKCELHESHNLIPTLLYNAPTKNFLNWRYAINLLSLLGYNVFLTERENKSQMFAYQYVTCRK